MNDLDIKEKELDFNDKNYYEVLEVPTTASQEDIHQGYIRAKNAYSNESLALYSLISKEECDHILEMIHEAYSIISDPQKRVQYDSARGINKNSPISLSRPETTLSGHNNNNINASAPMRPTENGHSSIRTVNTLVATKRFILEYPRDEKFEQIIEEETEFSGSFLKKIREYKQVEIQRMADMTKVSKQYLRNIEDDDVSKLPALVYVRGFVYQYAKCLKLNPDLVATSYLGHIKRLKDSEAEANNNVQAS